MRGLSKMIKRWLSAIVLLLTATFIIGCSSDSTNDSNTNQQTEQSTKQEESKVTIQISKDDGDETISENEFTFSDGDILMDVLKENYDVETDASGSFIVGIDGIKPSEDDKDEKGWIYTVNGEMPSVAADDYKLKDGDFVNFDFQAWK